MGLMKHAEEPQEDDDRDRDSDKPQKNAAHEFTSILTFPKRHSVDEVPFGSSVFHYLGLRSHRRRSTRLGRPARV